MFDRLTDRSRRVLAFAKEEAVDLHHEYVGTEHVLIGLAREFNGVAAAVLRDAGIDRDKVVAQVKLLVRPGGRWPEGRAEIPFTPRMKKAFELSMAEAGALGHNYIGTEHLLLGLIAEGEGIAAQALLNLGVTLEDLRQRVRDYLGVSAQDIDVNSDKPATEKRVREIVREELAAMLEARSKSL